MEKTYTEKELKQWFQAMMKRYRDCPTEEHLQHVYAFMFDDFWKSHNLEVFVKNLKKDLTK